MQRHQVIDFDLENTPLEIKTDSSTGSDDQIRVRFLNGDDCAICSICESPFSTFVVGVALGFWAKEIKKELKNRIERNCFIA